MAISEREEPTLQREFIHSSFSSLYLFSPVSLAQFSTRLIETAVETSVLDKSTQK